jgi:hypothetical protein
VEVAKASRGGLPEKIWMKVLPFLLCFTMFLLLFSADRVVLLSLAYSKYSDVLFIL